MTLSEETYYGKEANMKYMSVSQFKDFAGTLGHSGCEFQAMEKLAGRYKQPSNNAMLIGSYVDHYYEGTLDQFKENCPFIFKKDGNLKAEFVKAEQVIERINRDPYFLKYLAGDKQVIVTGEIGGIPWKIKMDSFFKNVAIVDLKVMQSIRETHYVKNFGQMDFIRYWGYDMQGAVYQEIVRQNTGKKLPFYIAAATKEYEPDIEIIQITQKYLDEAMERITALLDRVVAVKNGILEPIRCGQCPCCRHHKMLIQPIGISDLIEEE